ncbi:hypothetical protein [Kaistia sp. MMO-174]|uniref:hypothetical protein n=1 Tax=Kaistia sp. MMO-174 TaxID=3081256 RepID=UPI003018D73F
MAGLSFDDLIPVGKGAANQTATSGGLRFDDLIPATRVSQGFSAAAEQAPRPQLQAALDRQVQAQSTGGARGDGGMLEKIGAGVRGVADAATMGYNDELLAGIGTGFGLLGDYGKELARQRAIDAYDAQNIPVARVAGQVAGGVGAAMAAAPAGLTTAGLAAGRGLAARAGLAAGEGAAYGALYGAGSADGDGTDRVLGAVQGGALGAATGGAIPVLTSGARALGKPVVDAVRARVNPEGYAAQKVAGRFASDGRTMDQAAARIERAAQGGQSMSLADVGGENARGLLRTAVNVPGPGRQAAKSKATLSAMAQGDRLKALVGEAFGDPDGAYQAAKATVMDARSTAATPYYERAYKQPVPYTFDLEKILDTPAGRAALATAKTNSLNRREPWAQWFASIDDTGKIIDKRRVPDTRALDETQRVLGNMVEAAKTPADGSPFAKAKDTPQSIALRTVHQDLLAEMDKANPSFARAREVGLSNIQADEALEFGRNALNTDARVNARKMGAATSYGRDVPLTEGQRELARFGLAEAIRQKIDEAGMTHNAILKFFSTREQVARIRPFFKSDGDWKAFRSSIINEARKRQTYNAMTGNSTTARQLADMQEAGGLGTAVDIGGKLASGGVASAALSALQAGIRRVGGLTPQVADNISRQLMTRDPVQVRGILQQIQQIERAQISADRKAVALRQLLTNFVAGTEGREVGRPATEMQGRIQTRLAAP